MRHRNPLQALRERPARAHQGPHVAARETPRRLRVVVATCLLAILLCGAPGLAGEPWPSVGVAAPDFTLPRADQGGQLSLSSLRGRPAVVTFWAFWCDTWREVRHGYRELADLGVPAQLVAVAVDPTRQELLGLPDNAPPPFYPVLLDVRQAVSEQYHVRKVPTVLVLDARGTIIYRASGWPGTRPLVDAVKRAMR